MTGWGPDYLDGIHGDLGLSILSELAALQLLPAQEAEHVGRAWVGRPTEDVLHQGLIVGEGGGVIGAGATILKLCSKACNLEVWSYCLGSWSGIVALLTMAVVGEHLVRCTRQNHFNGSNNTQ